MQLKPSKKIYLSKFMWLIKYFQSKIGSWEIIINNIIKSKKNWKQGRFKKLTLIQISKNVLNIILYITQTITFIKHWIKSCLKKFKAKSS
jgi:hypothetical protein